MIRFLLTVAAALWAATAQAEVDIQPVTSPGGIKAWLVEEHAIPFVALEIRFQGGASLEAPEKRGATNLMVATLEEGAGDIDARGFAKAREELAASFGYQAGADAVVVSAQFLTENRDQAVDLLRLSLVDPRFDQDAVDRVRQQVLSGLASDTKDPDVLARQAFNAMAFGDHPYGSSLDGTPESVTALTRDDLVAAHQMTLTRDRLHIGAVGDITAEELGALLDHLLGDLPQSDTALPDHIDVSMTGGTTVIPFETPQSVAVFGHQGIDRDDPDFFAAYLLNQIMGAGGFDSRLMDEVRKKRGLTYGVYSYLASREHAETYQGSLASANDRIAEAIDVIRDEWAKMAEKGITSEDLERAKKYLTGAYPLRFDGNANIAGILAGMQAQDLPIDYINTRNDKVNAVTLEDANRVAAYLYQPENLHFIVVGQPEGVESTAAN